MGLQASVQTTVTDIDNSIVSKLEQTANASATANCDIRISSINMEETEGCSFVVENMCSSQATAAFDAILDIMKKTAINMSTEQKAATASLLTASLNVQTSVTNISENFENYVNQQCNVDSVLNNKINVDTVNIKKCISRPNPSVFKFINTGQSKANCLMKIVAQLKSDSITTASVATSMGTNYVEMLKYIVIGVSVAIAFGVLSSIIFLMIKSFKLTPKERLRLEYIKGNKTDILQKYIVI